MVEDKITSFSWGPADLHGRLPNPAAHCRVGETPSLSLHFPLPEALYPLLFLLLLILHACASTPSQTSQSSYWKWGCIFFLSTTTKSVMCYWVMERGPTLWQCSKKYIYFFLKNKQIKIETHTYRCWTETLLNAREAVWRGEVNWNVAAQKEKINMSFLRMKD